MASHLKDIEVKNGNLKKHIACQVWYTLGQNKFNHLVDHGHCHCNEVEYVLIRDLDRWATYQPH